MIGNQSRTFRALQAGYGTHEAIRFFEGTAREGFTEEERCIAESYVVPGDSLLLVGGGGGRDALMWSQRGNPVVILDLTPEMLQLSRQTLRGLRGSFVLGNGISIPLKKGSVDHVVFCDAVYRDIPAKKRRQKALVNAAAILTNGFLFLYCGWISVSPILPAGSFFQKLRVVKQWLSGNFSAREPGDALLRRIVPDSDLEQPQFCHLFQSREEVGRELRETGLEIVDRIGGIWVLRPRR